MGDVVPYIFCLGSGGESSKTGQADRARHPDEVRKADKDSQIGAVFSPLRLCFDALVLNPTFFSSAHQITTIICHSRYCHPLKDCARGLRELIVRGWLNASVSRHFYDERRDRLPELCVACNTLY